MDCPPIPQLCLDILLRSNTYLKERPPSASIDFHSLASLRMWFTHTTGCKIHYYTVVYISTRSFMHAVTHHFAVNFSTFATLD